MYVHFCCKMSLNTAQPDFVSAILVFCALENVGHFVCDVIIWENMQRACLCVCVHVCISSCVRPLGLSINTNMFHAFLMLFKAAPGG